MSIFALCACGQHDDLPHSSASDAVGKAEGLPVNGLSNEQLQSELTECMRFGRMDDPRVKYTVRYCSAVMSAHLNKGYDKPAHSEVDPSLNRLH